jgi:hypothetical protein
MPQIGVWLLVALGGYLGWTGGLQAWLFPELFLERRSPDFLRSCRRGLTIGLLQWFRM